MKTKKRALLIAFGIAAVVVVISACVFLPRLKRHMNEKSCLHNLCQIDAAKDEFVPLMTNRDPVVTAEQINAYIPNGFSSLLCPEEGTYRIGFVGRDPECSFHGTMGAQMKRLNYRSEKAPEPEP